LKNIILASKSPRRKKLLLQTGIQFRIIPSSIPEVYNSNDSPSAIVQSLALQKAGKAANTAKLQQDCLIIGADTIVVFENYILEKPSSRSDAMNTIMKLRSNTHQVMTGVGFVKIDKEGNKTGDHTFFELTEVTFANIPENLVKNYIKYGNPMDKAGAYGIQDKWGALFVEGIKGDYYNVMGFPLHAFYKNMKKFAPEYLPEKLQ